MIKFICATAILTGISLTGQAQYFYKDFFSNKQSKDELKIYKEEKIKKIVVKSYEPDGSLSKDFLLEKKFNRDYTQSTIVSKTAYTSYAVSNLYYSKEGLLTHSYDTSEISSARNYFTYDEDGRLWKTYSEIISRDDDFITEIKEEHVYGYGEDFYPDSLWVIKNKKDSTLILFLKDEAGNIIIEKDTRTARKYYYYYDEKSRLTDVVHSDEYTEILTPDYVFEYNQKGQIVRMLTLVSRNNYNTWRYMYDGTLRIKETVYDKAKKMLGYVEYNYSK
jgi:hypothetical protein